MELMAASVQALSEQTEALSKQVQTNHENRHQIDFLGIRTTLGVFLGSVAGFIFAGFLFVFLKTIDSEKHLAVIAPAVTANQQTQEKVREDIGTLKVDTAILKTDIDTMKSDVGSVKADFSTIRSDISAIKSSLDGKRK